VTVLLAKPSDFLVDPSVVYHKKDSDLYDRIQTIETEK